MKKLLGCQKKRSLLLMILNKKLEKFKVIVCLPLNKVKFLKKIRKSNLIFLQLRLRHNPQMMNNWRVILIFYFNLKLENSKIIKIIVSKHQKIFNHNV